MTANLQLEEVTVKLGLEPGDYLTQLVAYLKDRDVRVRDGAAWKWDQAARRAGLNHEVVDALRVAALEICERGLFAK